MPGLLNSLAEASRADMLGAVCLAKGALTFPPHSAARKQCAIYSLPPPAALSIPQKTEQAAINGAPK